MAPCPPKMAPDFRVSQVPSWDSVLTDASCSWTLAVGELRWAGADGRPSFAKIVKFMRKTKTDGWRTAMERLFFGNTTTEDAAREESDQHQKPRKGMWWLAMVSIRFGDAGFRLIP